MDMDMAQQERRSGQRSQGRACYQQNAACGSGPGFGTGRGASLIYISNSPLCDFAPRVFCFELPEDRLQVGRVFYRNTTEDKKTVTALAPLKPLGPRDVKTVVAGGSWRHAQRLCHLVFQGTDPS